MERNVTLDFVRGVAILGILLLNISAFGLPKAAYLNPAWYGDITRSDAWTWAILDLFAQVKFLTLFALLFGAGLQLLLKRGTRWIQSRLTLLVILGFIHGLLFWDGDILLAYGLVGLICWRLIRDAPGVKSLFNTGVMLYVMGLTVLLLLGMIADASTSRSWIPDAANLQYEQFWKLKGGIEAIGNRADMLGDNLLALGAQYGWQLAGMMLMGAALMRTGWLKGEFSLRHYRLTGAGLVLLGVMINLPAVIVGLPLVRLPVAGAARAERAVPDHWLCGADLWLLAPAFSPVDRQCGGLRWTDGVKQLHPANADMHHAFLPIRPVYEIRPPDAAGVCYSGLDC